MEQDIKEGYLEKVDVNKETLMLGWFSTETWQANGKDRNVGWCSWLWKNFGKWPNLTWLKMIVRSGECSAVFLKKCPIALICNIVEMCFSIGIGLDCYVNWLWIVNVNLDFGEYFKVQHNIYFKEILNIIVMS